MNEHNPDPIHKIASMVTLNQIIGKTVSSVSCDEACWDEHGSITIEFTDGTNMIVSGKYLEDWNGIPMEIVMHRNSEVNQ